ncbi:MULTISPECIES: bifunctional riboflavin kinase/FAD synthetase [Flavobacteriaceae]|uniref:Riboflavin biosynthesis protein n=2 Tax=Flavobacteriaceae TaxID=49546 RepID=A0A4Y8ATM6_9FLAO|nr:MULTISPECIES: bifunctional riboflavin kinase/FAD synthetase [Flavobacteriaceae]TEW74048.1 bifunctional riboflavin kinase/FAD synthetase [Gramella jeungdoensis]GGK39830.1 riboflavin biosynthesis protein [Lutibacter litoralis]
MKIFTNLSKFKSTNKTFVTIGTFDGVHIGHQKVIKKLIKSSKNNKATAVLLTFFPHPRMVLQKDLDIKLINTIEERTELLENLGLDILVIHQFSKEFAKLSALDFVRNILVNTLNISRLVIGYDHHFGKNREGNFEQLQEYGDTYSFKVKKISQKEISDITVSSTKVRNAIEKGEIIKANSYLGYNFMLTGIVVEGKNLGEKIGFPTANLHIAETYKLLPKTGAYIVKSNIQHKVVFGMMNIGFRPTVSGKHQTIEIHFFNFDSRIYGEKIQIEVLKFLREEQKFDSVEVLKKQLAKDKKTSENYINGILFD